MRSPIVSSALALALVALTHATPSLADPTAAERTVAETLFRDAKKLLARGKVPEACEKLASSYKIDPAGGTLLNLAMCHEIEGKTATAWTEFHDALSLAKKANRRDRQRAANDHIAALEKRLSRLTIAPPAIAPAGLAIALDGTPIESAALGAAIPVDPGDHVASATAPGKKKWSLSLTLREGKPESIAVPPLADLEPPKPVEKPVAWKLPAGIAALGAGAVLLGVGAGFGVHAVSLGGKVRTACPDGACTPEGWEALADGRGAARVSNGTLIAGGVAAAAGAVLVVLAVATGAPRAPTAGWMEIQPAWSPGQGNLTVRGVF